MKYKIYLQNFSQLLKQIRRRKQLYESDSRTYPPPPKLVVVTATLTEDLKRILGEKIEAAGLKKKAHFYPSETGSRVAML